MNLLLRAKRLLTFVNKEPNTIFSYNSNTSLSMPEEDVKAKKIAELRKNNEWSRKECAMLIKVIEDIYLRKVERAKAISVFSAILRRMGKKQGINVNELYRNENGIALQMQKMEFLLTRGKLGLPCASKRFEDVYRLYQTDVKAFNEEFNLNATGLFEMIDIEVQVNGPKKRIVVKRKKATSLSFQNKEENFNSDDLDAMLETYHIKHLKKTYFNESGVSNPEYMNKSIKEENNNAEIIKLDYHLSSLNNELDAFCNKFQNGGRKLYILTNRMMLEENEREQIMYIAHRFNTTEREIASIEKHLYDKIKNILEKYIKVFNEFFIKYGELLEFDNTKCRYLERYMVLLNKLSSYTSFTIEENAKGVIKIKKLDDLSMVPENSSIYNKINTNQKTITDSHMQKIVQYTNLTNPEVVNSKNSKFINQIPDKNEKISLNIRDVLQTKFQKGFRLDSHLDKERFKLFYKEINSEEIPEDITTDLLYQLIQKNGIIYNNRVYIAENMLDEDTKQDLFSFIDKSFENGHYVIYYTALFKEFSDKFLTHSIFDSDILREYLKYQNTGKYYIFKDYLSKYNTISQNISDEIIQLLVDRSEPFFQDELCAMLPQIDRNKLINELRTSSDFISNGKEQYFLARNFNVTGEEKETIKKLISDLLNVSSTHFVTAAEVMDIIHKRLPEIFENNGFISELGIRNALASILGDSFSFNSNVISDKNSNLNMNNIFEDFARNTQNFSLTELKNLASEFSSPIYFDAVNKFTIRISKDEFVSKDKIDFNLKEIDYAISLFCLSDYVPIQEVNTFASFPDVGYKWNTFLLESYLKSYSSEYKLFQVATCETKSVGVIVKKTSTYTNFDDILADAVAKSKCQLQKDAVLQFLCDSGYIARRVYSSIDSIIEKASQKRNAKG